MFKLKLSLVLLISIVCFTSISAQEPFQNPIKIPMYLSGSFAELRSNHFHSGIDIKTNEKIGEAIYPVADGWLSRINISPWGFGMAIYIDHPNGYTSVYAHLSNLNDELSKYIIDQQYSNKSFSINKYFKKNQFPVSKDEIIAYSGNSGGSFGPHLHFELRKTKSQEPINPLIFGFDVLDTIPPSFLELFLNEEGQNQSYKVEKTNQIFQVSDTIITSSIKPQLEIVVNDFSNQSQNKLGINKILFYVDNILVYQFENQQFSFAQKRYINAHIDYALYKKTNKRAHKLFLEPGNYLKSYKKITSANFFKNTNVVNGKVLIFDSKGNQSQLNLVLKHEANTVTEKKENKLEGTRFYYKTQNVFNQGDLSLIVPIRALYNDFDFLYKESSTSKYIGGKIYSIHKQDVPLHKYINLSLKLPESLLSYKDKLCLIEIEGSDISSIASKVEGDLLLAKIRSFGDYSIDIDSIPPSISFKSMNLKNKDKTIVFKITDDLSGISSYNAYLNNNWILFKYDYKTNELYYDLDNRLKVLNKEQELKIVVEDSKGNKSELIKRFTY